MFLGIPTIVWALQIGYVVAALSLYVILLLTLHLNSANSTNRIIFNISYVIVMIVINIIWRQAIRLKYPEWF